MKTAEGVATIGESISPEMMEQLTALSGDTDGDFSLPQMSDRDDAPVLLNVPTVEEKPKLSLKSLQAEVADLRAEIATILGTTAVLTEQLAELKAKNTKPSSVPPTVIEGLKIYGEKNRRVQDFRGQWISLNYVGQSCNETSAYNALIKQGHTPEEALDLIYTQFNYPS